MERLYQAISRDWRYRHYARIPGRLCRCLDYFKVASNRRAVQERLSSYYLFICVVDDVLDSNKLEAGREILEQLKRRTPFFNEETTPSQAKLVTGVLKCHISLEIHAVGPLNEWLRDDPTKLVAVGDPHAVALIGQRRGTGRIKSYEITLHHICCDTGAVATELNTHVIA